MSTIKVPVAPHIRRNQVPSSLVGLAPPELVTLSGTPPTDLPSAPSTELEMTSISAQWAVNLGFASVASVNVSGSASYFLVDFFVKCNPVPGRAGTLIVSEHYGAGFRICVKAWDIDSSVKVNVQAVAAGCTAGAAKSSYEVAFLGLGLCELGGVAPLVGGSVGSFDASAIERIGALMSVTTTALLVAAGTSLRPVLLAVELDPTSAALPYAKSFSTSYALQSIWERGLSLEQALAQTPTAVPAQGKIDPKVVGEVYAAFLDGAPAVAAPTSSQKETARGALFWRE